MYMQSSYALTNEVIWIEQIIVPHLDGEPWRQPPLCCVQTVEVLLLPHHHDFLLGEVFKGEQQTPVEVSLSIQGAVVDISLLGLIQSLEPPAVRSMPTAKGN